MTPGMVIAIPAEVKHWHGAAKDSWFQHLTYHKDVQEGSSNEWLEPVTDEEYERLKWRRSKEAGGLLFDVFRAACLLEECDLGGGFLVKQQVGE